jgi:non-ribosomal peptide synthetase component E (peptide arylation enzyme)
MKATRYTPEMIERYTNQGLWTSETWPDIYANNARLYPDKEAFVSYGRGKRMAMTWAGFLRATDRLALGFLEMGLEKDARVLCQLPSCIENVLMRISTEKAGLIHCYSPINTWESENDHFLNGLQASAVVTIPVYHRRNHYELFRQLANSGRHPHLKYIFLVGDDLPAGALSISQMMETPIEDRYPADFLAGKAVSAYDVSQVMTTSGSTGMPKMVEMTTNSNRVHGQVYLEKWELGHDDICFTTGFLWSGPTVCGLFVLPQVGGKIIMEETFDTEEALQIIEREKPTYISCFPSQVIDMVNHPDFDKYDKSSLRFFHTAGAPFPVGLIKKCEDAFKIPYMNGFGAVDSSMIFTFGINSPMEIRHTYIGTPSKWDEYKVVKSDGTTAKKGEVGVLYWRGPGGTGGYYQNVEQTKKVWGELGLEGWYNTEDAARIGEDGNVCLVGRVRDMIQRGGQNIFPSEIEDAISAHPKVAGVQVVPMPDTRLGEKTCAFVIPKKGKVFNFEDMTARLAEIKMARYKYPERLEIVESFEMVGQKINKRGLSLRICRQLLAEGQISQEIANDFERKHKLSGL